MVRDARSALLTMRGYAWIRQLTLFLRPDQLVPGPMAEPVGACYILQVMTPFDPNSTEYRRRRFRPIPVRMLVPNMITLLAICAGLTAIRLSTEGRMELAVAAIVFAAILDGIDGRVARMIKGQSKFGAELDSLADFVNFGVAPGLILYFWQLHELNNGGWIAAMVFAISGGLRLARFNASIDDPNKPAFAANYFTGVPAPAGAITVLLPIYLAFLGVPMPPATLTAFYTLLIAFLMVSRLPVFSGKTVKMRVPPEMVLPVFVAVVFFVALLIGYPWHILSAGSVAYLISLPWGWKSYRDQERQLAAQTQAAGAQVVASPAAPYAAPVAESDRDDRPTHLH
jgi:CDP-diacylglycerol---serine O-phosphatidyltransferase